MTETKIATPSDIALFEKVAETVFDHPISQKRLQIFLNDPRHHMAIACRHGVLIGFVSAVDYIHPDKPKELWINEVGVGEAWRRRGVATALMKAMLDHGRAIGCDQAWVLTEPDNAAANALYASLDHLGVKRPSQALMYSFK